MPEINVIDLKGSKVGSASLDEKVFGVEPKSGLVHEVVIMQGASARQGTASTKGRGEVAGSGKKPWKQKHTGRARAGSVRSPIWRTGGTVFGPKPRSYGFTLPRKKYRAALRSALSSKVTNGELFVVKEFVLDQPKTKLFQEALRNIGIKKTALVVIGEGKDDLHMAGRNIKGVKVIRVQDLNVYDVLRYEAILIPEGELGKIQEVWS